MDLAQLSADLEALRERAVAAASSAPDTAALDGLEVDILGKKGELTATLRGIGGLPAEDRPKVGAVANAVRTAVEAAIGDARASLGGAELAARLLAETVDVTTPGRPIRRGSLHPITETAREIAEVFAQFGFVVYEGPEIEDDVTNFQMLNIPPDHPARDLWDTLYLDVDGRLLRTHTSPGQIRVMHQEQPPIRALLPGRCFRYEAVDASHASEFFQVEGLMVDEGTSMADLKGLLDQFAHAMFGADRPTRFRPGYYPFTEPSVAFDILCVICDGAKCPACSRTGWMTILGAGMVHPTVLRYGGIDPERYQGFAFGMGVERIANLRHHVVDLRAYMEDDLRFLGAFPMRVPLSWLREFVDVDLAPDELAERLTLLGMEVKSIERWGADWENVVTGELLTVEKHPRADRLSLTTVTLGDGSEPLSIVCGATNIAAGQRVPVALPGAMLPGDRRIERAEKMGVVSNGMLCSGAELNLTADADGILILPEDTPLGVPLADLYGDVVLDVDVKPNRGDALSILGLAREVAAATGQQVRWTEPVVEEGSGPAVADRLVVDVRDPDLCPRFVGRWVSGVSVQPSPDHVQMRLIAAGQRPVSNVVDASNYVMLELGKPIHTFDAAAVHPGPDGHATIVVRRATAGERLETLDHVTRELPAGALLIADPEGPIGIAGVMGAAASEISPATTDVVVESAIFDPVSVRRTAQRLGLRSEASSRFEKGQEFRMARIGADRTAQLLTEWAGGIVAPGVVDTAPDEPPPLRIPFRPARVNRLLGTDLTAADQQELLARVGVETEDAGQGEPVVVAVRPELLVVDPEPGSALTALVPSWRRDIAIEADVAEEVARVRGYELVPSVTPDTRMPPFRPNPLEVRELVRDTLAGAGVTEVVTTALVSPEHVETFALRRPVPSLGDEPQPAGDPIAVTNPLSRDHSVLRRNLLASLVDVVGVNLRHGTADVAVFEIGKGYARVGDDAREWWRLGFALVGDAEPAAWNRAARPYDLDDAKGVLELLASRLDLGPITYAAEADEPVFHPGRTARATVPGRLEALVGELHPSVAEAWELRTARRVLLAEVALEGLSAGRLAPQRAPVVGRHPEVDRDLAIVVPEATPAAEVEELVRRNAGGLLRGVALFDIYRGAPLAPDEKSLAFRIRLGAADRTLTEPELEDVVATVVAALPEVRGRLRG